MSESPEAPLGQQPAEGAEPGKGVTLADAIADARLLLHYAASRGVELEDNVMAAVVAADHARKSGDVSGELELAFWKSFRQLAGAVAPVTVQSIRATVDFHPTSTSALWLRLSGQPLSDARWSVFKYRWLALFFLLVLLSVQMFWVVGASLTSETVSLTERIKDLETGRIELTLELGEAAGGDRRLNVMKADIDELRGWLNGSYQSLRDWNDIWSSIVYFVPFLTSPFASDGFKALEAKAKDRIHVTSAEFVLQALSAYVLPLLYGLLGAFAYVLRDIAREVRDVTFSVDSTIRYGLRLSLGLLSGIAVGLLLTPGSAEGGNAVPSEVLDLKTLSPLALAFVAGYAVELIFAAMDRIVTAFTGDRTISARSRAAQGEKGEKGGQGA